MSDSFPKPFPPPFADAWGDDRYGLWAELRVNEVTQRLRWIEPGSFLMGSPDNEPGRASNEGQQHLVTLTEGLWLADTACTQGLWQAVMGNNPSYVTDDAEKPVEQVSWDDVLTFFNALQAFLPEGVVAVLPTEAQWEYACRAGSKSAYSFGDSIKREQVNFDNDNQGYERYKEKQTTVPVKALPANPWGLYQMHGNVWEWCADAQRNYTKENAIDPSGAREGDYYAVRGGSWYDGARLARSALRFQWPRGFRTSLGFRFALRSKDR